MRGWAIGNVAAVIVATVIGGAFVAPTRAADDAAMKVERVVRTAGGEEKLLKLFRFRERVLITSTPAPPVKADEKGNRTSVVQVGGEWWIGDKARDKDKVRVLCWAWSLRVLLDPKAKVSEIGEATVGGMSAFGLRVEGVVRDPVDLWFGKDGARLAAIDYQDSRHLFSEWTQTSGGHWYPTHVVGHRFADRAARTTVPTQWYQTDILELTPLAELPAELRR